MNATIKTLYGILPEDCPYIEDIYDSLEDARQAHPGQQIMVGYGIVDEKTGFLLENTKDWYDTYEEVQTAFAELST